MLLTFKSFTTIADGTIYHLTVLPGVQPKYTIEETVGDEFSIKHGDLTLQHSSVIPRTYQSSADSYWLGVFDDADNLLGVYEVPEAGYEERSDNPPYLYRTRLKSIQNVIFDDFANTTLDWTSDTNNWGRALIDSQLVIKDLKIIQGGSYTLTANDVVGFSLSDMLEVHFNGHNYKGYNILGIDMNAIAPLASSFQDDVPILFRGESFDMAATSELNRIRYSFFHDPGNNFEPYNLTWRDIFHIASFTWNSLFKVNPAISGNTLIATIDMLPRTAAATGASAAKWAQRKKHAHRYQVSGVHLKGDNFEYIQGGSAGALFKKTVPVGDPEVDTDGLSPKLYWVAGDYDSTYGGGFSRYNILNAGSNNRPYFSEGFVTSFYTDILTAGHGYTGTIEDGGQKVFDEILIAETAETIRLLTVRKSEGISGKLEVEGIVVV